MKVGFGWDIHRLSENRPLVLGGVTVPSPKGELGHSDGDVLVHAVIDALLGAGGLGDIGSWFPDTDPKYANISSTSLLNDVMKELNTRSWCVVNLDSTVILEAPKLSPYSMDIRESLAACLQIPVEDVSLKAKTAEGLGSVGAGEAVEAYAVVLIQKSPLA